MNCQELISLLISMACNKKSKNKSYIGNSVKINQVNSSLARLDNYPKSLYNVVTLKVREGENEYSICFAS